MKRGWWAIRGEVWRRDDGICQVCGRILSDEYPGWECGHLVDRVAGGEDSPENCVAMCIFCNRLKPVHDTLAAARAWIAKGGPWQEFLAKAPEEVLLALQETSLQEQKIVWEYHQHHFDMSRSNGNLPREF